MAGIGHCTVHDEEEKTERRLMQCPPIDVELARVQAGPVRPGPVRSGLVRPGPVRPDPIRSVPTRTVPIRSDPIRSVWNALESSDARER